MRKLSQCRVVAAGLTGALASAGVLATVGVPAAEATPGAASTVTVVASGLNNPRGVAWSSGRLYVAEAGTGGSDCPAGLMGPEHRPVCVGLTGSIAQIDRGRARNIVSGLFSSAGPGGAAASGVAGLTAAHGDDLKVVMSESVAGTFSALPKGTAFTPADTAAARAQLGRVATVEEGRLRLGAHVGDADYAWSARHKNLVPDQFPDANPNAVKVVGDTTYVVDAASNTLDSVTRSGLVRQLAFFPNPAHSDAVPTCIDRGPDGALYIGELAPGRDGTPARSTGTARTRGGCRSGRPGSTSSTAAGSTTRATSTPSSSRPTGSTPARPGIRPATSSRSRPTARAPCSVPTRCSTRRASPPTTPATSTSPTGRSCPALPHTPACPPARSCESTADLPGTLP